MESILFHDLKDNEINIGLVMNLIINNMPMSMKAVIILHGIH